MSEGSYFSQVTGSLGVNDNEARLLVSLFIGYPLGLLHRNFLYGRTPWIQHTYFTMCGLAIAWFNFGMHALHSLVSILLSYLILQSTPGQAAAAATLIFNMVYLICGYYSVMSPDYVFAWTTPQCLITLRMTGLAWDLYDGKRKQDKLSEDQKKTALATLPSLLEVFGYNYFCCGFLVGPHFPMKRYQDFAAGVFSDRVTGGAPASVLPAVWRLCAGICYAALYRIGEIYLPDVYLLEEGFQSLPLLYKCGIVIVWGKFILYKYAFVWLTTEGSAILTGITYNGPDKNGNDVWDGCSNIDIWKFENVLSCHQLVESFHMTTNKWVLKYIFKRLKFLGSKAVSQLATLFFLALWHGLYTGYMMCFFFEFIVINLENNVSHLVSASSCTLPALSWPLLQPAVWVVRKAYYQLTIGYALISFYLFTYEKWGTVYSSMNYCLHVVFIMWIFIYPAIRRIVIPQHKNKPTKNGTERIKVTHAECTSQNQNSTDENSSSSTLTPSWVDVDQRSNIDTLDKNKTHTS